MTLNSISVLKTFKHKSNQGKESNIEILGVESQIKGWLDGERSLWHKIIHNNEEEHKKSSKIRPRIQNHYEENTIFLIQSKLMHSIVDSTDELLSQLWWLRAA